ncbi:hypothetical protein BDR06DRAFT_970602 [Suillus hirtellus]|nr:hypothetical protein BDR06DRAFT_970602 [Suillus hirtellus]
MTFLEEKPKKFKAVTLYQLYQRLSMIQYSRFTSDELIQKHRLTAEALDFKTCLSNNFPAKVLIEDDHVLMQTQKDKYNNNIILSESLDLVEEEKEQITHQTFKFDPNNLGN